MLKTESQEIDLASLCAWGEPKPINTKNGPKILRKSSPTEKFWELWRANKDPLKRAGVSISKYNGAWEVTWWQDDIETATKHAEAIVASKAAAADVVIPAPLGLEYLPYQKAGVAFATERQAVLIADEMGLGKTIQALGLINSDPSLKRILVVCPATLKLNWAREAKKWLVRPISIGIAGKKFPEAEMVIINYQILKKFYKEIHAIEWDLIVIDEAHLCKNRNAIRTISLLGKYDKDPAKAQPPIRARRKAALTGTPILNRPAEAFPILNFLDPENFKSFFGFATKYCDARQTKYGWDFSGASNLDQLQKLLRTTVMVRRLKKDVLAKLPAKRRQLIELDANGSAELVKKEQEAHAKHEATLEDLKLKVELARLLEGKEEYEKAINELKEGQGAAFEEMSVIRHDIAMQKVPRVIEHVLDAVESGPVVVFAWHRDVVDALMAGFAEAGKKAVKLVGGMPEKEKQASVDAFQAGEADVFVGNIQAAGVGITLVRSSHVIFAELDWVPANLSQAEDRCHRIGQQDSVLVQHLVLEGSLDQVMAETVIQKQNIADAALDDPLKLVLLREPVSSVTVKGYVSTERDEQAEKEKTYSEAEIANLHGGIRYLAAVCDGANELDGAGFNRFDSAFGKALASLPSLTQHQAAVAERLCQKYRGQLRGRVSLANEGVALAA